ncbi:MAG: indole-3-glycerol-phosphate synthase [Acidobacteriota bacterium]|nr:indole-3-glycerol-phosphate synthase [Acidobacteriota bacterium]
MTDRVLERLVRAAEARAERLAAGPAPGAPERPAPCFHTAIGGRDALSVIAEFKRKSPSAGAIRDDDPGARALAYREAGASAVSVLTDPDAFGGSLDDLSAASAAAGLPILMKDFIVDPAQIRAGWAAGASAVLLIVRCLDDARLRQLHREARSLGLDALVEVHDAAELDRALALEDAIVGINNRDLDTLRTDRGRARDLLPQVPSRRIAVAESGYLEPEHLTELRGRADAVLIGTALMRAADPSAFLRAATEPVPAGV